MAQFLNKFLSSMTVFLGLLMMGDRLLDNKILESFASHFTIIAFNTALCFFLAGIALLLPESKSTVRKIGLRFSGYFILSFSTLILLQTITGIDIGLENIFNHGKIDEYNPNPGRMVPPTAVGFMLCGTLLVLLSQKRRRWTNIAIQIAALTVMAAAIVGIAAAAVRFEVMYNWYQYGRMAMSTAVGFLMISVSLWLTWYHQEARAGAFLEREDQRISVTGIVIIMAVGLSAGMSGFGLLANQMEQTLETALREAYNNRTLDLQNTIEGGISGVTSVTTRLLLNRYLTAINRDPNDAEAQKIIKQDAASFLGPNFSAIAIYSLSGQLVAQVGEIVQNAQITVPLTLSQTEKQAVLLWKDGAVLHVKMDITSDGKKIGTAVVERKRPHIDELLFASDLLGDTAETRVCYAISENEMQCLPSRMRRELFAAEPRIEDGDVTSMDFALRGKTGLRVARDYRKNQTVSVYGPIGGFGLGAVVGIDTAQFYGPLREKLQYAVILLILLSGIGVFVQRLQLVPFVARLVKSEERIKTIMANVADGIITINEKGVIESVNAAVFEMFGYSEEQVVGQNVTVLMPERMRPMHQKGMSHYLSTGEPHVIGKRPIEIPAQHADGHEFTVLLTISEMRLIEGRFFVGNMRDITESNRLEKLKSQFVSTVSHELRTPLTSIRGSLGLVIAGVSGVLPEKAKHLIDIAYKNCERLIVLINDILDIERIESGQLQFTMEWTNLKPLMEQAIELNKPFGEKHNITIEAKSDFPTTRVYVDSSRFLQIMSNLLSNAAKFSHAGEKVEVSAVELGDHIAISVTDYGMGIPEEFRSRIFDKFAQADSSDTKAKGGTGLGLSIAKAMAERMGGSISFISKKNEGTTFVVNLPIVVKPGISALPRVSDIGNKILVCEDDPAVGIVLKQTLEQRGFVVDVAFTARQAIHLINANTYVGLMLDLILPDKDGVAFIGELRAQEATAELPIIVISAKAEEGKEAINGRAVGIIDWLQKPIDQSRLIAAIGRIRKANNKPLILHVEDDYDIAQVISMRLHDVANVVHVSTLEAAQTALKNEPFDLVLLDIMLPDGSGIKLIESLNGEGSKLTPVIIFSANEVSSDVNQRVAAALVKSKTSEEEIVSTITSFIKPAHNRHDRV
jgi:PAS domain S-box-containing protein